MVAVHFRGAVVMILLMLVGVGMTNPDRAGAAPVELVRDEFEAYAPGSSPAAWPHNATGDSYVQVKEALSGNRYLQIYDASKQSTQGIQKSFAPETGKLGLHARLQLPSGATAGKANILLYVADGSNQPGISLILSPTRIVSHRTVSGVTTSQTLVQGMTAGEWFELAIAADVAAQTFALYVDGAAVAADIPFRHDSVTSLSNLRIMGAYYGDDANWVRIANMDDIALYSGGLPQSVVPAPIVTPPPAGSESRSFDRYSSVFLSSRWFRQDGQDGQLGTLDVLKRFMATGNKWAYITDEASIHKIFSLGVGMQGGLNMNHGTGGRALDFDGTAVAAPWMTWGATWGSMNDPVYFNLVLEAGKAAVDAGVRSFQFDDWRGSVQAYAWGGDFNPSTLLQFKDYLEQHYTATELNSAFGIADIETFAYKTYLEDAYDIETNSDYVSLRGGIALDAVFKQFLDASTRAFHVNLQAALEDYAEEALEFSNNASFIRNAVASTHFLHDLFDYGMGEHHEGTLILDNIVANGALATGLGKPHILSPYPVHTETIRQAIAAAYAMGQYFLVPWDIWMEGTTRYFGTVDQYGDLFHFIRQYPFLFDGKEVPASTGILLNWSDMNTSAYSALAMRLFEEGVPFRVVVANDEHPVYALDAGQLDGLTSLIELTPLSAFATADQQAVTASGVPLVSPLAVDATWLAARSEVAVDGPEHVYAALRADEASGGDAVIHVLNRSPLQQADGAVSLLVDSAWATGRHVALYRPGHDPLRLVPQAAGSGQVELILPAVEEWAIVYIGEEQPSAATGFELDLPWSGVRLGNPAAAGLAEMSGDAIRVSAAGAGFGLRTYGDGGEMDQVSYVYRTVPATPLQAFSFSAEVSPDALAASTGASGLMLRATPASNAAFVAAAVGDDGLSLIWREADNEAVQRMPLDALWTGDYLRLERTSAGIAVRVSEDGENWGSPLATVPQAFEPALAGLFVRSDDPEALHASVFADAALVLGDVQWGGAVTGIELEAPISSLKVGDTAALRVTASVYGAQGAVQRDISREAIMWSSSDTSIAAVDGQGRLLGVGPGVATVTASVYEGATAWTDSVTLSVIPPPASLLEESFDSYGELDTPPGWTIQRLTGGGSYVRIAPIPTETDQSLEIYDNILGGFPSATAEFEAVSEAVRIAFDFRVDLGDDPASGGAIVMYVQNASGQNAVSLLVDDDGFWYLDGNQRVTVAPAVSGQWVEVEMVVDPVTRKLDLWLDGQQVVTQGNFRETVSQLKKVHMGGSTSGVDTLAQWNNLSIRLDAADGEPQA
ncbi:Ig-like domain-containing protein [Paenibacillus sp. IB182496]|uniref:Ig-like domain-containing protein n=1 Tax=Paenibacillus sabuli TaxID=2772509 RepID=A0A927BVD2_9BACL|nr:Ig-like domain-containing protein [Paenibacillus sabuli]MBD2847528.1 Ig-like domain-containing protein [Paenibacillus sabuli]